MFSRSWTRSRPAYFQLPDVSDDLELEPTQRPWWQLTKDNLIRPPRSTASQFDKWRYRTLVLFYVQFAVTLVYFGVTLATDLDRFYDVEGPRGQFYYGLLFGLAPSFSIAYIVIAAYMKPNDAWAIGVLIMAVLQLLPPVRYLIHASMVARSYGFTLILATTMLQFCLAVHMFMRIFLWYIGIYLRPTRRKRPTLVDSEEESLLENSVDDYLDQLYHNQQSAALEHLRGSRSDVSPNAPTYLDDVQEPFADGTTSVETSPASLLDQAITGEASNLHSEPAADGELPPLLRALFQVAKYTDHQYDEILGTLATFSDQRGSAILSAMLSKSTELLESLLGPYPIEVRKLLLSLDEDGIRDLRDGFANTDTTMSGGARDEEQDVPQLRRARTLSFRPHFRWEDRLPEDMVQYFAVATIVVVVLYSGLHGLYVAGKLCFGDLSPRWTDLIPFGVPALSLLSLPILAMPLHHRNPFYTKLSFVFSLVVVTYWGLAIALSLLDWVQEPGFHATATMRKCQAGGPECCQVLCASCLLTRIIGHVAQMAVLLATAWYWCWPCLVNAFRIRGGFEPLQKTLGWKDWWI